MIQQFYRALAGLWTERENPAVVQIINDALAEAERELAIQSAIHQALSTEQVIELFAIDRNGKPVILQVCPVQQQGRTQIRIFSRPADYRLFQVVGEA